MKTQKYCALDVHKDTVFTAIVGEKEGTVRNQYETFTAEIRRLAQWLKKHGVQKVAMESTDIYWVPVWRMLEEEGFTLILVNPYLIKQMPGRKSDVKDSEWIATLMQKELLRGSFVPGDQGLHVASV